MSLDAIEAPEKSLDGSRRQWITEVVNGLRDAGIEIEWRRLWKRMSEAVDRNDPTEFYWKSVQAFADCLCLVGQINEAISPFGMGFDPAKGLFET